MAGDGESDGGGAFRCVPEHRFFFRANPEEEKKKNPNRNDVIISSNSRNTLNKPGPVGQRYQSKHPCILPGINKERQHCIIS